MPIQFSVSEDAQRSSSSEIVFGCFRLLPTQRLLLKNGVPVEIGSRALDILMVLASNVGKVVSNAELIKRVWQDVIVEESSLRVHISALRRKLACEGGDSRYVVNVPGRGYSFVATVCPAGSAIYGEIRPTAQWTTDQLPPRLIRMVGREDTVLSLADHLKKHRLVTIIGPGGMGKTTVAVAVAHSLSVHLDGDLHFFDLGSVTDPALLEGTLASAFGVLGNGNDIGRELVMLLQSRRLLLVLDNCEHLIDATAALAEKLFLGTSEVHILATSREPLLVEGEYAYRLGPLACPPEQGNLSAASALSFAAVQLFVERASSSGNDFILNDCDAPVVAHICRQLDGVALAIELGAGRVDAYGIRGTAELLNNRFRLFWSGRRTALPRHQTLFALLDWSYNLLSEKEASVMRRLSVLRGGFALGTALKMVLEPGEDELQVIDTIGRLVAKSLISAECNGRTMSYRLLDTTRVYALEKLRVSGEADAILQRHALFQIVLLEQSGVNSMSFLDHEHTHRHLEHLGGLRAALEWAFSEEGDLAIGVRLAVVCVPLFLGLSLLDECQRWSEQALAALDSSRSHAHERVLQEALAISLMFTHGNTPAVHRALIRGIELAERLGDAPGQLRLLAGLNIFLTRAGDFRGALKVAHKNMEVSTRLSDAAGIAMAQWMLGVSCHLVGQQAPAERWCTAGLAMVTAQPDGDAIYFGYDHRVRALVSLARTLWLRGEPDRAVSIAHQALEVARNLRHPVTLCISLIYVSTVFLWVGDWTTAGQTIDNLTLNAKKNALKPDQAVAMGLRGILLMRQGKLDTGVTLLKDCLDVLAEENHQILSTMFMKGLAEGLALKGEFDKAQDMIDQAQCVVESSGETFDTPEVLRIAAQIQATRAPPDLERAELILQRSLDCARRQSALGWELRSAITLARMYTAQGRNVEAGDILGAVYRRFSSGFDSVDLRSARQLLLQLPHTASQSLQTFGACIES
jgi:predicted ATPase/DNA-binding winged helix-turn-helix (wHTH) protein